MTALPNELQAVPPTEVGNMPVGFLLHSLGHLAKIVIALILSAPSFALAQDTSNSADRGIVTPVASCGSLKGVGLTGIDDAGSAVVSATVTTSDGIPVCSVEGKLAPEIKFRELLATKMDPVGQDRAPDAVMTSSTSESTSFGQPDFAGNEEQGRRDGMPP